MRRLRFGKEWDERVDMSLRRLAEDLGLSQTTVSRALNGYPEVSETTRHRVQAAAREIGYAPNMRARALATGRAYAVGHVIPAASQHEIVNPVFADFIAGAGTVYEAAGYDMVLTLVPDGDVAEAYRRLAARGRVDGVIVQAPAPEDPRIAILTDLGLPFVVHGRASRCIRPYSWYDIDNRQACRDLTAHLAAYGHRRIALLNGPAELDFAQRRSEGYSDALAAAGLGFDGTLVHHDQMTEFFGYSTAARMLGGPQPPTAFVTASLLVAWGVRRACEERGLTLGRDVSIATHDDGLSYLPNGARDAPLFTATRAPVGEAGRACATMLLQLIGKPDSAPLTALSESPLVCGPSTGPAPTAG